VSLHNAPINKTFHICCKKLTHKLTLRVILACYEVATPPVRFIFYSGTLNCYSTPSTLCWLFANMQDAFRVILEYYKVDASLLCYVWILYRCNTPWKLPWHITKMQHALYITNLNNPLHGILEYYKFVKCLAYHTGRQQTRLAIYPDILKFKTRDDGFRRRKRNTTHSEPPY
jgi:hypothetical protein